jgi:hypothetical protein
MTASHLVRVFGLELCRTILVLNAAPLAVGKPYALSVVGIDFERRIRVDLSKYCNLAMLGMERGEAAGAGREDERILLHDLFVGNVALMPLLTIGLGDRRALRNLLQ